MLPSYFGTGQYCENKQSIIAVKVLRNNKSYLNYNLLCMNVGKTKQPASARLGYDIAHKRYLLYWYRIVYTKSYPT